jgi:hypothetical protein
MSVENKYRDLINQQISQVEGLLKITRPTKHAWGAMTPEQQVRLPEDCPLPAPVPDCSRFCWYQGVTMPCSHLVDVLPVCRVNAKHSHRAKLACADNYALAAAVVSPVTHGTHTWQLQHPCNGLAVASAAAYQPLPLRPVPCDEGQHAGGEVRQLGGAPVSVASAAQPATCSCVALNKWPACIPAMGKAVRLPMSRDPGAGSCMPPTS